MEWGDGEKSDEEKKLDRFKDQLIREGYEYQRGTISHVSNSARLNDAKSLAEAFDANHISEQIKRIENSIDTDPALAIGQSKELTESCFKTILGERGIPYGNEDLPQLGKKAFHALKLIPDYIPDNAKGSKTIV